MIKQIKLFITGNQLLVKNITGTVLIKGLAILLSFISMPFYIDYFNNRSVLGLWFTILSIINWVLTFDLGIGNGLRNNLSEALVRQDKQKIKELISSAYIILGIITLIITIAGCFLLRLFNWNSILNVGKVAADHRILLKTVLIIFCSITLQLWLRIIISILYALQRNVLANSLGVITNLIILFYIAFFKTGNTNTDLVNLAIVNASAVIAPLIFATVYVFAASLKESKPAAVFYSKDSAKKVLSLGGAFFIIQISLLVIHSTNQVLISKIYNAGSVVDYQLYYKIFSIASMVLLLFTQPVWSAITHAYAENNLNRIKNIYKCLTAAAIFGGICCFAVIPFLQTIFDLWLGIHVITANSTTAVIFAFYSLTELSILASTCIANGISKLKCQLIFITFAAVIKIPITLLLSAFIKTWDSVMIANIIILLPIVIIQPIVLKKHLNNAQA